MMRRTGTILFLALAVAACGGPRADDDVAAREGSATTRPGATSTTTVAVAGASVTRPGGPTLKPAPGGKPVTTASTPAADGTAAAAPLVNVRVKATKMATLRRPIGLAARPGELTTVYIATKEGEVRRLYFGPDGAALDAFDVLDISAKVSDGGEQGLLGIVFSPDGGTLYASYTDKAGAIHIAAFPFVNGRAQANEERTVLKVEHPQYPDHNGGQLAWGPEGLLYVGLGDGGGVGDPFGNAQNLNALLGKVLRIKPNPAGGYAVPPDNPLVGVAGARPEIWHYGLRNPWRFSFDRANGEQWIADVGQNAYEEINHVAANAKGVNFGWNKREGKHAYSGGAKPAGAVDPEFEMAHTAGNCAITGGYVYRGAAVKGLGGIYLFADYCKGELVGAIGGVMKELGVHVNEPASFGEDATGELWVLSQSGGVFRLDAR